MQEELGIQISSSFILQVKNPLAPASGGQRGLSESKRAKYPTKIMQEVFGKGSRGRESYGLRFTSCERIDMLDYEGAELLLIAAKGGDDGLEASLGEGRGEGDPHSTVSDSCKEIDNKPIALHEVADEESKESVQQVFLPSHLNVHLIIEVEDTVSQWIQNIQETNCHYWFSVSSLSALTLRTFTHSL